MARPMKQGNPRFSRSDACALALLLVTAVFCAVIVLRPPRVIGRYVDDGIYLATGKALADGQGYRHIELPGAPYQAKYPILYPLLLALVWRSAPSFPDNISIVQIINVACWTVGSWCAYRLMTRSWKLPWWLAMSGVVLGFANTYTLGLLGTAMPEGLYLALSMAGLLLASPAGAAGDTASTRFHTLSAAGAALLAAAAYLTRAIGITLIVAILADLLLRRRWKQAGVVAIIGAATLGGWQAWRASATASNATVPAVQEFRYDLDYSAWVPHGAGKVAWVIYQNTAEAMRGLFQLLVPTPAGWVERMAQVGVEEGRWFYLGMLGVTVLTAVGAAMIWRRGQMASFLYLGAYLGLVLGWPFEPARFLVPLLPLLGGLLLAGTYAAVRSASAVVLRAVKPEKKSPAASGDDGALAWAAARPGANAAFRVVVLLALLFCYLNVRELGWPADEAASLAAERGREAVVQLVREHTPQDAVIATESAAYLYLRTGRRAVPLLPFDDPLPLRYPPDRPVLGCGLVATPGYVRAVLGLLETRLTTYLRATGATHLVEPPSAQPAFAELRRKHPHELTLVGRVNAGSLYAVSRVE